MGVTAECLTAWHRGEDSVEAEAGGIALAEGLRELRLIREALTTKAKG